MSISLFLSFYLLTRARPHAKWCPINWVNWKSFALLAPAHSDVLNEQFETGAKFFFWMRKKEAKKLSLEWRQTAKQGELRRGLEKFFMRCHWMSHSGWEREKALRVAGQFYISMSFYHCAEKGDKKGFARHADEQSSQQGNYQRRKCGEIKGARVANSIRRFRAVPRACRLFEKIRLRMVSTPANHTTSACVWEENFSHNCA